MATNSEEAKKGAESLHAYLAQVWTSRGLSEYAWCQEVGVSQSTVNRLGKGQSPATFEICRRVADVEGLPILDLLLAAHLVAPGEVEGVTVRAEPPAAPDLLAAIDGDPTLRPDQREAFLAVYNAVIRHDPDKPIPTVKTSRRR